MFYNKMLDMYKCNNMLYAKALKRGIGRYKVRIIVTLISIMLHVIHCEYQRIVVVMSRHKVT